MNHTMAHFPNPPNWNFKNIKEYRWFQHKSNTIEDIRLEDRVVLDDRYAVGFFRVSFQDGPDQLYLIPFDAKNVSKKLDITDHPKFLHLFFHKIGQNGLYPTTNGKLVWSSSNGSDFPDDLAFQMLDVGSSNTLIMAFKRGEPKYIFKLLRRLHEGDNLETEVCRFLREHSTFQNAPTLHAQLTYETHDGKRYHIANLFDYVDNLGSAWDWTLHWLSEFIEVGFEKGFLENPKQISAFSQSYLNAAATMGQILANFHEALASTRVKGFEPALVSKEDIATWHATWIRQMERSLHLLREFASPVEERREVLAKEDLIRAIFNDGLTIFGKLKYKIRQHGDFHLGQVIVTPSTFYILDFEGEPLKPFNERATEYPALKDVAGMLRSFNYASFSAYFDAITQYRPDVHHAILAACRQWEAEAQEAFWKGYFEQVKQLASTFLPQNHSTIVREMLRILRLEKALYELEYEIENRPDWVRIPLSGILRLLEVTQ